MITVDIVGAYIQVGQTDEDVVVGFEYKDDHIMFRCRPHDARILAAALDQYAIVASEEARVNSTNSS